MLTTLSLKSYAPALNSTHIPATTHWVAEATHEPTLPLQRPNAATDWMLAKSSRFTPG